MFTAFMFAWLAAVGPTMGHIATKNALELKAKEQTNQTQTVQVKPVRRYKLSDIK